MMRRENLTEVGSLAQVLRQRAAAEADRVCYRFLRDSDRGVVTLTYRELDACARTIAAHLQSFRPIRSRALLLYPGGPDYAAALFGCFYAGVVAVPINLPRAPRSLQRLEAIASDSAAHPLF